MPVAGKSRSPFSLLVRPRLGAMRPVHSKFAHQLFASDRNRKPRYRKTAGFARCDMLKKSSVPDYTDVAYREAVSRLRYLLNESYVPQNNKYLPAIVKPEESDDESGVSVVVSDRTRVARLSPYRRPYFPLKAYGPSKTPPQNNAFPETPSENMNMPAPPELMAFIERQEEYIEQLEKESQYCRDELSELLGKVKDLIAENEALHEQQKTGVLKTVFDGIDDGTITEIQQKEKFRKRLEGPLIVFESRISELEAQLTQSKIDLRKSQEETEIYKKKALESDPATTSSEFYRQIENLQREKRDLNESLAKLQASVTQIREKEIDASKRAQRTLSVVDKTQFEKQQAEMEVNRLKNELEHQHDKLLEVLSDQTRKVADERGQAERRYLQHVEQLSAELAIQRDAATKLQLELEKHLRIEDDLRRDLAAKNTTIENVKKELNNKISSLQNELSTALTERDSLEQELSTSRMSGERSDRVSRQESSRLQVEISALRQRLDRADAELMHARRENLRLAEQIASQEKEITLYKIKLGEGGELNGLKDNGFPRANELNSRISDIETKHVETVSELEGLIENQSQVMAQLKSECQSLTQKLEESSARHKEEMGNLQSNLDYLTNKLESTFSTQQWMQDAPHHESFIPEDKQYIEETAAPYSGNGGMIPEYGQQENYEQQQYENEPMINEVEEMYIPESNAGPYESQPNPQNFDPPDEQLPVDQEYSNAYRQSEYDDMPDESVEHDYGSSEGYKGYENKQDVYEPQYQQEQAEIYGTSYPQEEQPNLDTYSNFPSDNSYQQQEPSYLPEQPRFQEEEAYQQYQQNYDTQPIQPTQPEQEYTQPTKMYQPTADQYKQSSKPDEPVKTKMTSQPKPQKTPSSSKLQQKSPQLKSKDSVR